MRKIAPKRFNPKDETWLPVLHTRRGDWHFTVLYSNTQRAHELGKTHDWVVIYFHPGSEPEAQCTVVTETHGPLEGRRLCEDMRESASLTMLRLRKKKHQRLCPTACSAIAVPRPESARAAKRDAISERDHGSSARDLSSPQATLPILRRFDLINENMHSTVTGRAD